MPPHKAYLYYIIYYNVKGQSPIIQQWALSQLITALDPLIVYMSKLLKTHLAIQTPNHKSYINYIGRHYVKLSRKEVLCTIYLALIQTIRQVDLSSDNLDDYMYILCRELLRGKTYGFRQVYNAVEVKGQLTYPPLPLSCSVEPL